MKSKTKFDPQDRLIRFSADVILNIDKLKKSFASEYLMKQLIRSVTSAALNYGEAQSAESRRVFIHKMKICLKELRESQVNMRILKEAELINERTIFKRLSSECDELVAIFTTSVKTTTSN